MTIYFVDKIITWSVITHSMTKDMKCLGTCVKENIEKIIWFNKYLFENLVLADTVRYVKLQFFFNLVYSILHQFILIFGGVG